MKGTAGYSGTPLPKKLGLQDGQVVGFAGLPETLDALLNARAFSRTDSVADWTEFNDQGYDYLHLFTKDAETVDAATPKLRKRIKPEGMIWMSWPKKASGVQTDVTEDVIRNRALQSQLVDVKVCAVDEVWSGLKLVIRKEYR